jgi:probable rRNA maturation factor
MATNELAILNAQRTKRVNTPLLRRLILHVLREHLRAREYELGIHLVDADEMARVNEQFLQHTGSTDVITFDYSEREHAQSGIVRGEVYISIPDAVAQAKEFGTTWESELARYAIHALLHLRGYDDLEPAARRVMKREENRLLRAVEKDGFAVRDLARR